jgi:glycogen phosphorylase
VPFAAARDLAVWKRRVTRAWGGVRIDHVESEDGDQGPGSSLVVRATVALGELSPEDVNVEVVYGRVGDEDEIIDPAVSSLGLEAGPEGGVARFAGKAELGRPGPFGYTLRVVPRHPLLASDAELGLVTLPEAPAGLTTGDLR